MCLIFTNQTQRPDSKVMIMHKKVYEFVQNKFGRNGYVKYWLDIPQTTQEQNIVWSLLDDEKACKSYIAGIFDEVTKGKYKVKEN